MRTLSPKFLQLSLTRLLTTNHQRKLELQSQQELAEVKQSLEDANAELQRCIHTLFAQKRHYESQLEHLMELLRGSEFEIGGLEFLWKKDI